MEQSLEGKIIINHSNTTKFNIQEYQKLEKGYKNRADIILTDFDDMRKDIHMNSNEKVIQLIGKYHVISELEIKLDIQNDEERNRK